MNPHQARIVDPVLSHHARGYKHPDRVGTLLFPRVDVDLRGGNVIEFGKESFIRYATRRAPGGAVKQIDFGYQGRPYRLNQDALDVKIPEESLGEAEKAIPGVDLGMRATNIGMNTIGLGVECDQAALATDPARYDSDHKVALAGADKWTDPDSDPITVIETGKEAVRTSTGLYPAVMVLSPDANRALRNHPKIIERFKLSGKATVTPEQLAELFDLRTVAVGKAVVADQAGAFQDVWKNCAVLAYVPENPNGNEEPSFGYTYTLKGNPITGKPYYDNGTKSWLFRVVHEWQPLVTGMAAGYFIQEPA